MIHPRTRVLEVSPAIGLGLFATADLPRGTITWAADPLDRVLAPAAVAELPQTLARDLLDRFAWQASDGNFILTWDNARFVNHSCAPNCISSGFGFEMAVRDIAAGAELTNDYADLGMQHDESFVCACEFLFNLNGCGARFAEPRCDRHARQPSPAVRRRTSGASAIP